MVRVVSPVNVREQNLTAAEQCPRPLPKPAGMWVQTWVGKATIHQHIEKDR
jgi:hypothetical protein